MPLEEMTGSVAPQYVNWDMTYACQLRCTHCYSESGRRPVRKLPLQELLRITDALISMRPKSVQLSGGEPLLVNEMPVIAQRFAQAGIPLALYTNGLSITEANAAELVQLFARVHVSIDGATAPVHDAIRGKAGSFEGALRGLTLLDRAVAERRRRGGGRPLLGIDCVVLRSNFHQLELYCTDLAPRFPELGFVSLAAGLPSGLASRESYAELELLSDEQLAAMRDRSLAARLQALAPAGVAVYVFDNFSLQMNPELIRSGKATVDLMHVEPDGGVRGMPIYEGTVGNLLEEPPQQIWRKALERHRDPFVVEQLTGVRTMEEWAAAARRIDQRFGSPQDLARIAKRPEYVPPRPDGASS